MKYHTLTILSILILNLTFTFGQDRLILQRQVKPGKQKVLRLDRYYTLQTRDTTYSDSEIISFTDSTLSIPRLVKTGKDTTYTTLRYNRVHKKLMDTTIVLPQYIHDTLAIPLSDIVCLKKNWLQKKSWLRLSAWFALAAVGSILLLPVAAIDEGMEGVKNWAVFEGFLLTAASPVLISFIKTKYDLKNKWTLRTGK